VSRELSHLYCVQQIYYCLSLKSSRFLVKCLGEDCVSEYLCHELWKILTTGNRPKPPQFGNESVVLYGLRSWPSLMIINHHPYWWWWWIVILDIIAQSSKSTFWFNFHYVSKCRFSINYIGRQILVFAFDHIQPIEGPWHLAWIYNINILLFYTWNKLVQLSC